MNTQHRCNYARKCWEELSPTAAWFYHFLQFILPLRLGSSKWRLLFHNNLEINCDDDDDDDIPIFYLGKWIFVPTILLPNLISVELKHTSPKCVRRFIYENFNTSLKF